MAGPAAASRATRAEGARAVERALDILLLFDASRPKLGVSEIARELGFSKSTAHRLLSVLASRGMIMQDLESRRYSLGLALLRLGRVVAESLDIRQKALPVMRRLQEQTGETVNLNVERDGARICIEKVESRHDIRHFVEIGRPLPLHCGASGKVLLAFMPAQRRKRVLSESLSRFTRHTLTDPEHLERDLELIRRQGYATSRSERVLGAASVSAPIRDASGRVVAALTVSGPEVRFTPDSIARFIDRVVRAANEVSGSLGWPADGKAGQGWPTVGLGL